jgi:hypothetical protein
LATPKIGIFREIGTGEHPFPFGLATIIARYTLVSHFLTNQIVCVGSIAELEELSGVGPIKDLHRENIDHITIPSKTGKGTLKRIEEVFDCWFESGRYIHLFSII